MLYVETDRLSLRPLTPGQFELCLSDHGLLEVELALSVSRAVVTDTVRRAIGMKLRKLAAAGAERYHWYTYWLVVLKVENFGAGLIGFKGVPDGEGAAEIGYGIDPLYQSRGYVTEAARALVAWAFGDAGCKSVVAPQTLKSNPASNRVLAKIGMEVYRETETALYWRVERDDFNKR